MYQLPEPLSGFENVNRYWDKQLCVPAAKILPGEFYVSVRGEMISTVLGSCISACIRDKKLGIGGMNHFMLPTKSSIDIKWGSSEVNASLRYGNWAMEYLINEVLKQGGKKNNLEVKIFGGGKILSNLTDVGKRNIDFVRAYIFREGLTIAAQDVGEIYPRKVLYFSDTGAVKLRKLRHVQNDTLQLREKAYIERITNEPYDGGIDLF